jgi:hypothetical protein
VVLLLRRCDKCYSVIRACSIKDVDKLTEDNKPNPEVSREEMINFIKSSLCWKCYKNNTEVKDKEITHNVNN